MSSRQTSHLKPQEELRMQNPVILSANSPKSLAQNVVEEELVTTRELAQMLGVDVKTIQRTSARLFDIDVVKSI